MKKRFDYYEFKKNISLEVLHNMMSVDEYVSALMLNIVTISYIPLVAGIYIVSHIVAIFVFSYFNLDCAPLLIRFNKLLTSYYVGNLIGFLVFIVLAEMKHKEQTLRNLMLSPIALTQLIRKEVNGFKKYSLMSIVAAAIVFMTAIALIY